MSGMMEGRDRIAVKVWSTLPYLLLLCKEVSQLKVSSRRARLPRLANELMLLRGCSY